MLPGLVVAGAASAAIALGTAGGSGGLAAAHPAHAAQPAQAALPARQAEFRQDMRAIWEEHIVWTRMAIVDVAAGLPGLEANLARLLRHQTQIGDAVTPFYGRAAGARLSGLLRGHILVAVEVLGAAKAGHARALARAQARWRSNGAQIADFLHSANPAAWPKARMRRMMAGHLRLTGAEALARLSGRWRADVRAYDKIHTQILHMADMLSAGIIAQFPARFR